MLTDYDNCRSKTRPTHSKSTSAPSAPATTPSSQSTTADTSTASATSTGPRTRRRSASTSTALSTYPNPRHRKSRLRRRVSTPRSKTDKKNTHSVQPLTQNSQATLRAPRPSQGRARLHRRARAHPPQHRREHQRARQVVEHLPNGRRDRRGHLPGLVAQALLRGQGSQQTQLQQGRARLTFLIVCGL